MRSTHHALALFIIAGATISAHAAPFSLLVLDNGGTPGALGAPLRPSFGTFYSSGIISMGLPPSPDAVVAAPQLAFDSYVAMGGMPASETTAANPPSGFIGSQFIGSARNPLELRGVRYVFPINVVDPIANPTMAGTAFSRPGPLGADTVFIGRLTVPRGARPVCPSIVVGASFNLPGTIVVSAALDGDSVEMLPGSGTRPTTALHARSMLTAQVTLAGFGDADVYDLYVVSTGSAPSAPPPPTPPPPASNPPQQRPPAAPVPTPAPSPVPTPAPAPITSAPANPPLAVTPVPKQPDPKTKAKPKPAPKKPAPKPKAPPKAKSPKTTTPALVRGGFGGRSIEAADSSNNTAPTPLVMSLLAGMGTPPAEPDQR